MSEPGEQLFILINGEPFITEIDDQGVQRFVQDPITEHLFDSGMLDLHQLYIDVITKKLDGHSYMQLYMCLGVSVSMFEEKFGPGGSWEDNGREPVHIINPLDILEEETIH